MATKLLRDIARKSSFTLPYFSGYLGQQKKVTPQSTYRRLRQPCFLPLLSTGSTSGECCAIGCHRGSRVACWRPLIHLRTRSTPETLVREIPGSCELSPTILCFCDKHSGFHVSLHRLRSLYTCCFYYAIGINFKRKQNFNVCNIIPTFNRMTCRVGKKISMIYINDIYHDSIMIFSRENIMIFSIFSKYQPLYLLFTYFSNSCISSTNCPKSLSYQTVQKYFRKF